MKLFNTLSKIVSSASVLGAGLLLATAASAAPFHVSAPAPTTTFVNQNTTFHSDISDGGAVIDHCRLSVDGSDRGATSIIAGPSGKSAFLETSISSSGSHAVRITCYDASESNDVYGESSVTVFADSSAPGVGPFTLTPGAPEAGVSVNIQTNYDDTDFGSGIDNCSLFVDDAFISLMNLSGGSGSTAGTADRDYTFSAGGSYSVRVECTDLSGNVGTRSEAVAVTEAADTTAPSVGSVTPTNVTAGVGFTFAATYSDAGTGVTQCELYEGATLLWSSAAFGPSGSGTASVGYSFASAGTHDVHMRCRDAAGNWGDGPVTTVTVATSPTSDTIPPTVGPVNWTTLRIGSPMTFQSSATDNIAVTSCDLYLNGSLAESMTISGSNVSANHTLTAYGSYTAYVRCRDAAGNTANGATGSFTISSSGSPYARQLVKLACPTYGTVDVNHPCKAVYYVGSDGQRHAFPNEKVYFTWYSNFDSVITLDSAGISAIPLGGNVNYRPGSRMVKFTTVNNVYAVSRYGVLRWVNGEAVASSLYGSNWNTKIDDISDAFFTDYTFGADINSASDYNLSAEQAATPTIDDNL